MSIYTETEVRVIAMLDGKPGHEKQTMGIIQALQRKVNVNLTCVNLKKQSPFAALLHTCALFVPGVTVKDPAPGFDQIDLVIGTGSHTHLPLLLYKKHHAVRAVTCMSPAPHLRRFFDLCFVPEHDGRRGGGNMVQTVGAPNMSINRRKHQGDRGLILLGGIDRKSHHWDSDNIVAMVEKLVKKSGHLHWTLSSSPRTPEDTVASLHKLADSYNHVKFCEYRDTPVGWIEQQYDTSSVVWVTSDSISMIYEALSAGCMVGVLPMQWKRKNCKFRRNEAMLVDKGLVRIFSDSGPIDTGWSDSRELNEAQRCAMIILEKWWPNSLQ